MCSGRVLVIDDDQALLRMLQFSLRDLGYEVTTAVNGADALAKMDAELAPNAVVVDIEMPVMDGWAFLRELRARGNQVPVLMVSAYDEPNARQEPALAGFIRKPFDPADLAAELRRVTDGRARP